MHILVFSKVDPPTDDIEKFYNYVKPIFERAKEAVNSLSQRKGQQLVTTARTKKQNEKV